MKCFANAQEAISSQGVLCPKQKLFLNRHNRRDGCVVSSNDSSDSTLANKRFRFAPVVKSPFSKMPVKVLK